MSDLVGDLRATRERFLELVAGIRVELHRYCARMTGSIADGEDIVQDTLARAYFALGELDDSVPLRPWLFKIAQNRAIDHLRRYEHRMREPLAVADDIADTALDPEDATSRDEAVRAAVSRFVTLPPAQRSCVILKDVLGHSLDEIADLLELSIPAVKAALHRGRVALREAREPEPQPAPAALETYAKLFGARDWDGVRALLADDVRLDLVSRSQRAGRRAVGTYYTNYSAIPTWRSQLGWLDGRPVIAVFRDAADAKPSYVVELTVKDDRIVGIRDYRYVPYILDEAHVTFAPPAP